MKISDIARELDVPGGTVKGRLHDAKSEIKKGIHEMQGGDQSPPRAFLVFFSISKPSFFKSSSRDFTVSSPLDEKPSHE